jgi:pantoate kinase
MQAQYLDKCLELGLTPVAQVVRYIGTGSELPLGHYGLGVRGATALAEVLRVNKSLSVLRLGDNHLGGKGCGMILDALRSNPIATVRHTCTTVLLPCTCHNSAPTQ